MIAKCIAILAIVAQINASSSCCGQSSAVLPTCGSPCRSSAVVLESSGNSGCSSGSVLLKTSSSTSASGAITRNLVAKGKYPVALRNCGPTPDKQIPVTTSHVTAPVQEKPTVRLPCNIPAPKTICHSCTCYKTIVRPRVHQHVITVPTVQRYIETTHRPIIENIQYEAVPVNCEGAQSSSSGSSGFQFVEAGSRSSCGCGQTVESSCCQTVEAPRVCQTVEVPRCSQTVEVPRVCQTVEVPRCSQTVEVPRVQVVEAPRCSQTVEVPRVQVVEAPRFCQTVEVPRVQVVEAPRCSQTVEVPRVQVVEAPRCQNIEIPQLSFGSSSCSTC